MSQIEITSQGAEKPGTSENLPSSGNGHLKTLILVDGHSLAYRMHFALERTDMRTSDGTPSWAVYGFFNALFSLLKKIKPDAMAVAFDVSRITFRNELFPEYKSHRDSMPDEMRAQMDLIRHGVSLLGVPIYETPGYEADDVIGTLACKAAHEGFWVQILTGDQDAFQLVDDLDPDNPAKAHAGKIEVLIPARTPREEMKTYDRQAVFEKWGVYPEQVVDFKGLKGDTSDNIPGVPGVGDKTAVKLLTEYGDLDTLYNRLSELPANKLREKLETYREQAFLSRKLATIERHMPLEVCWESCHLSIPDMAALTAFLERMEFRAFLRQASTLLAPFTVKAGVQEEEPSEPPEGMIDLSSVDGRPSVLVKEDREEEAEIEEPLDGSLPASAVLRVPHEIITTHEALKALIARVEQVGVFALDVETTSLDVRCAKLAGIAISIADVFERYERPSANLLHLQDYPASFAALRVKPEAQQQPIQNFYIPIRQADLRTELDEAAILSALEPLLTSNQVAKLVHNLKFERNIFRCQGILMRGLVVDTMIASYVDLPDRQHGLKALAKTVLGLEMQEISALIGSGKKAIPFSDVGVEAAAAYSSCDAFVTLALARDFFSRMNEAQQTLLYEIELPLAEVLADLEWTGIALDTAYLSELSRGMAEKLAVLETDLHRLAGGAFNPNSPRQVAEILFDRMGIAPSRKTKGKTAYSTDVKVLEQLADEHEIVRKLLEHRQLFKLKSTYIDALPALIHPETRRLHTSFNQTVTATGRLSSSNPNLQNIPIRSEIGRQIRQAFVPGEREGWLLLSADYSQIELRILAHFSEDPHLIEAFRRGEDIHTATAALVFGVAPEAVTKEQRYRAKAVNFGVIYGQSPYGLSLQLKIPQAEAAEFIRLYFSRYEKVKSFITQIKQQVHQTGKVATLAGHERDLSRDLQSRNASVRSFAERAAFNTPLQGSAADLMKIAMIRLHRRLQQEGLQSRILLQVHDELVLETPQSELEHVKALTLWAMSLDQPLRVPLVVDFYAGPTWME